MVKLTYHGHACFEIGTDDHNLIVDPFLEGNPLAHKKADEVRVGWIIVTHGHGDHWGDTPAIAKNNDATVISNFELSQFAGKQGLKAHPLHIGGKANFPFGWVKLTIAHHGSTLGGDEGYGGSPAGALINIGGKTIYHAGDTGLFLDMQLIGDMNDIDVAMLPVGDNFTMGPEDAAKAVEFVKPRHVIPMHYDTFDVIKQDIGSFRKLIQKSPAECIIMNSGETRDLA
jgi:L-ascorbate metabolism protein UlaG (beta-lactamase superfamily)